MAATATILQPLFSKSRPPLPLNRPNQISPPRRLRIYKCTANEEAPPPPEPVRVRFRGVSRRKKRQMEEREAVMGEQGPPPPPKKTWEEMSTREKAMELYVGEKGLLFWLNKFAYASIYIIIGVWILFRFVGPALNLYQLDAPPLTPTSLLKGP